MWVPAWRSVSTILAIWSVFHTKIALDRNQRLLQTHTYPATAFFVFDVTALSALATALASRNTSVLNEIEGETTMSANAQHSSPKRRPQAAIGRSVGRHQHELKELSWQT